MALERFRKKSLYDKHNRPLSNDELKKVIAKVKEIKVENKSKHKNEQ